jgi:aryl-alcohol dehydrogenase-like predicted oxidoreductase
MPALRGYATRARVATKIKLTPQAIRQSVDRSLMRLGVERIDLLMLHEPVAEDVIDPAIVDALIGLVSSGKVVELGVAGDMTAAQNASGLPGVYSTLQFANNPFAQNAAIEFVESWRVSGRRIVTHSALGAWGALADLIRLMSEVEHIRNLMAGAGYAGPAGEAAANFLIDYALATNPGGVALFSVAKPGHLSSLLARVAAADPSLLTLHTIAAEIASRTKVGR